MEIRIPEKRKIPGVCYVPGDDGIELPVVDVTHPAFQFDITPEELAGIEEKTLRGLHQSSKMPPFLLKYYARRSIVMRGTMQAAGGYLSGMATYLQKLGPDNLGRGYAGRIDRRLVSTIAPVAGRIRLRNMARGIADGLSPALAQGNNHPLHLLNIGGGTAIDSLNALILIHKEQPQWLDKRQVIVHVLDLDTAGPGFGARALAAATAADGPLAGLAASFDRIRYDWADPGPLERLMNEISDNGAAMAGSSEGGLFEYGTDDDIIANLSALDGTSDEIVMVGSIIRDGRLSRTIKELGRMTIQIRRLDEFGTLVSRAGWRIVHAIDDNPLYDVVTLKRS
jgi:hypothetical protein